VNDRIDLIEIFEFRRPRDDAYLGTIGDRDFVLGEHHIVRHFNGTVYPTSDRSVVVRIVDSRGSEGWGETYGLVAPRVVADLVEELLGPLLGARPPEHPVEFWDAAYALQRNRGYWGGYLADALAAIDIALWDLHARRRNESLQGSLGSPGAGALPCYVSGLPAPSTAERVQVARAWQDRGFDSLKIPISATNGGNVADEMEALREALGQDHRIAVDLHWTMSSQEVIALDRALVPFAPWFLEAPTQPEDIEAQREIAASARHPMALGEEWRTEWDYRARLDCCDIVQPEMGHCGITQFMRMADLAQKRGAQLIPHATIGLGIFMAASLRASLAAGAASHEFQHTIYHRNGALLDGIASCEKGAFDIPDTPGHGVSPNRQAFDCMTKIGTWSRVE
jgi:L-alanine-DL-glutamate epimerase-like enolase superfamily enzyme